MSLVRMFALFVTPLSTQAFLHPIRCGTTFESTAVRLFIAPKQMTKIVQTRISAMLRKITIICISTSENWELQMHMSGPRQLFYSCNEACSIHLFFERRPTLRFEDASCCCFISVSFHLSLRWSLLYYFSVFLLLHFSIQVWIIQSFIHTCTIYKNALQCVQNMPTNQMIPGIPS